MNKLYLLVAVLPLCGCLATVGPTIVNHDVIVQVPCNVILPEKPTYPLTDTGSVNDNIFIKSKKALAEIEARKAYEAQLEAAATACTKK